MKIDNTVVAEAAVFAAEYFTAHLSSSYCYHNLFRTLTVLNVVDAICAAEGVGRAEKRILIIAAWFHDIGYTQQANKHEEAGAIIAEKFLRDKHIDEEQIATVKACILATGCPQTPQTLIEKILCDADMFHVGSANFVERLHLLRKEWEVTKHRSFTDGEWFSLNSEFLKAHVYHTQYCRVYMEEQKNKNQFLLGKKINKHLKQNGCCTEEPLTMPAGKEKHPRLERGVETLFRVTAGNHMKLSAMADNKAHILLSINSIIVSVVLSFLMKNFKETPYLIFPAVLLLSVSLVTIVFAVLTTKPKISKGIFTAEQIQKRRANLLYFGNFYKMDWESYEWGIREVMYDKEYLYKSLTRDIYYLGKVLAVKYRYLEIGYKVFMFGLISAVAAFGLSWYFLA